MLSYVFDAFSNNVLTVAEAMPFALSDARKAHDALEARTGGGALVLLP